ncbi:ABC transporter permease [Xylanimonas allomyrinae]|uniref:ABC transporter permease n=1 Tax=Xylanimonas allomyrinae TaxID=2509459 RepID=A0A4P6ER16_9MICO|nr:ABC transporter permease subunit [Xylanimonas allomyrinae]QAY62777.1 ABC transporter permease [Xylanimonas allomyrinae]
MNLVVMQLTSRALLGRRRSLLLLILPLVLLALAALVRWTADGAPEVSASVTSDFAIGTALPLLCLLIGTGVIGPEIDDGSIVYLLAKPVPRWRILVSKLAVALAATVVLAVLPIVVGTALAGDDGLRLTTAFGVGALLAGIAYTTIFVALSTVTRNAVVVGLLYALVWESLLGGFVPGVRNVSVRQWALASSERLLGDDAARFGVDSAVSMTAGWVLLAVVSAGATWIAISRLRTLRLTGAD